MDGPWTAFRYRLGFALGWAAAGGLGFYLGCCALPIAVVLLAVDELRPETLAVVAGGAVAVVALAVPATAVMVFAQPVRVGPDGVVAFTAWGTRADARWAEVTAAGPLRTFGMRFVRAAVAGRRANLWVPLDVRDPAGLVELIEAYAGDDHPLAAAVRRAVHPGSR
jgi:hypothetical protein